ncbi:MAG TPA: sulfotransferase [Nocardioidaceae bacterium]|nr:sulfotransferase [Nocardioidaceae bacterium]
MSPQHVFVYGMSRSGTTLMTAVLDAHPEISMGYELLPKGLGDPAVAARRIRETGTDDPDACAVALRALDEEQLAVYVLRSARCLVWPTEAAGVLESIAADGVTELASLADRTAVSQRVTDIKSGKEGTRVTGWKLNNPRIGRFDKLVDDAAYVCILRDPRDVWRSHVENDFERTVDQVARTWRRYLETFEAFSAKNPGRCHLVRYEDLVSSPRQELDRLCEHLGIPRDAAMDSFFESKASVLRGGHANSELLNQDFFTTSVGLWRDTVAPSDVVALESGCYDGMDRHGYRRETAAGFRFDPDMWSKKLERLASKRAYFADEYERLMLPAVESLPARTWHEACTQPPEAPADDLLLIRHDIDQDIENAVAMARWEAEHGIRSTYCVLHSAWYYGRFDDQRNLLARSEEMVERCLAIQDMGHEINLHNNLVVIALKTGRDPYELLAEELEYLRSRGLRITGTSTHGDPLCGEAGFYNMELFSETVYSSRGGRRIVEHQGRRVEIGARSMAEFDLQYEGYDLPRDVYISDSGGKLKLVTGTPGRAGLSRDELGAVVPYRRIIGMLTHPVWWDFGRSASPPRPQIDFGRLLEEARGMPLGAETLVDSSYPDQDRAPATSPRARIRRVVGRLTARD